MSPRIKTAPKAQHPRNRPVYIRLPWHIYEDVVKAGAANHRTVSAEIVHRLDCKA
jgi:hypothetical protein